MQIERAKALYGTDVMKQAVIAYGEMVAAGIADGGSWPFDVKAEAVFIRDEEGEIIALIIWRVYDDAPEEAWIHLAWVEWRWRRQGLYRRMLADVEEQCRERGIRRVEAAVREDNTAAREAVARLGFTTSRTIYARDLVPMNAA
jgi:GNAT superfamily N-acetyltransferase